MIISVFMLIYQIPITGITGNYAVKDEKSTEETAPDVEVFRSIKEYDITETNPYKGQSVAFYGDSLTEKDFACKKGYHQWIAELAELDGYENYGVHGYTLKDIYREIKEKKTNADIIFIMGGTNDQTWSVPYGKYTDCTEETTCGSLYLICEYVKKTYPDRKIIFITPPYQSRYPHKNGVTYDKIGEAIIYYSKKYDFLVYDNGRLSGINEQTVGKMTFDGCHWTDETHELIGKAIAEWLLLH